MITQDRDLDPNKQLLYVQVSIAVPWSMDIDPLLAGALAMIVMGPPGIRHWAMPDMLMVARVTFDDVHDSPLEAVRVRVMWSLNIPVAVN
ncbi:MAG: hypothetical protein C5B58_07065 [Acidobacteria bacterium]|nr:MAG: hypothetical protein C5B58_07065 [Acidobacteriota bacterium]